MSDIERREREKEKGGYGGESRGEGGRDVRGRREEEKQRQR